MKKILFGLAIISALVSVCWAGSGPDFQEGQWEMTVETNIPGMPMKMPPTTYTQCMRKDDPVPHDKQPSQECKVQDMKTEGNTVSWKLVCNSPGGQMTGIGKVTYQKNTMNGTITMKGQDVQMVTKIKGRRIGDCN